MIKLSPSALWLYQDCKKCFWQHHNEKKRRPSGIFPSLPSGMDKVLKNYFDSFRPNRIPPEIKETGAKLFVDMEKLKVWRNNFKGIQWIDPKSGALLRGAVDDILEKNGKLIVLDYKTRGYPLKDDTHLHYQKQIDIYNFLLRANGYKTENYGYLLFYHPKHAGDKKTVTFNTDLIKMKSKPGNGKKLFLDAVACLDGDKPKLHLDHDCKWCKYEK